MSERTDMGEGAVLVWRGKGGERYRGTIGMGERTDMGEGAVVVWSKVR
jgi:hypothetical protein